jgi:hypothetical protein
MGDGMSGIWIPVDNQCYEYRPTRYQNVNDPDIVDSPCFWQHDLGGWVIMLHQCESGCPYMLELVCNYELIPQSGAVLVTASPCVDDPLALSHALNTAQTADLVVHTANGFNGLDEHPTAEACKPSLQVQTGSDPKVKRLPNSAPEVLPEAIGCFVPAQFGASKYGKSRMSKGLAANAASGTQPTDTFSKIMGMLLPLAEKFLPELVAMLF